MFQLLLAVLIIVSLVVAAVVVRIFDSSVRAVYRTLASNDFANACARYVMFAAFVVGLSTGARTYRLDRFIHADHQGAELRTLDADAWTLEIWTTIDSALQNLAWVYLWVFHLALIAYVLLRCCGRIEPKDEL
jgi:hypothetical protein